MISEAPFDRRLGRGDAAPDAMGGRPAARREDRRRGGQPGGPGDGANRDSVRRQLGRGTAVYVAWTSVPGPPRKPASCLISCFSRSPRLELSPDPSTPSKWQGFISPHGGVISHRTHVPHLLCPIIYQRTLWRPFVKSLHISFPH